MSFQTYNGAILVDRVTIRQLLHHCRPTPLKSDSTMFDVGVEHQKQHFAKILAKEFGIDLGYMDVGDAIRMLNDATTS